ncbi:Uncharacterized HTH-type transcriptional regulator yegW [Serratia marcescens]|uniref:GntR family transcriptional regulator n=1 Tax=Serratia marcescens TaxID=615 RepID=UPI00217B2F95|nr:GntR family transcriptional regulator [Serratia marcescens]CAI1874665.1 Uncharacterized HTH-type transcriptional regulator yegW [Serratia marcescens]HEJ7271449.1 GntR family transcriptional regulator [Serratia marcescens]
MTDFMAWLRGHLAQGAVAPRYIQLAAAIETAIRQQVLAAEAFLPPERQMAEGLALSRVTVSKAMKLLEDKGLISRQQGVGTRVAMRIGYSLDKDSGFTAQALRHGSRVSNRWLLRTRVGAPAKAAAALGLAEGDEVIKLRRLRLLNGSPVSLETTYISPRFLPDPAQLEHSLYALWQSRGIVPEDKHFLLKAVSCSDEVAELLNVPCGAPLLHIIQTSRNAQGEALEFSDILCRSDVYEFEVNG